VTAISGVRGPGWHLLSLPVPPSSPDPAAVFTDQQGNPVPISGNLHRYDHDTASYITYFDAVPDEFGSVEWGNGYWLYLHEPTTLQHVGSASIDFEMTMGTPGWYLMGCPENVVIPLEDVQVTNLAQGLTTDLYDAIHGEGWIADTLFWYDSSKGTYAVCGFDPWDDSDSLQPWTAYWLYALEGDLKLTMSCAPDN
jgi:hypothetical protein